MKMAREKSTNLTSNSHFAFHLLTFLWFLYTFCWHFGTVASHLTPGKGFGWFFKYLTFCGFTFQMLALFVCVLFHLFPQVKTLRRAADDCSCASFPLANVIALMYWVIYFLTSNPVEIERGQSTGPLWLSLTMHIGNAVVAWADVHISERTFRTSALQQSLAFAVCYIMWIQVCAFKNKMYPYPFLNHLPQPEGFIGTTVVAVSLIFIFFKLGSKLATVESTRRLAKLKAL